MNTRFLGCGGDPPSKLLPPPLVILLPTAKRPKPDVQENTHPKVRHKATHPPAELLSPDEQWLCENRLGWQRFRLLVFPRNG